MSVAFSFRTAEAALTVTVVSSVTAASVIAVLSVTSSF